MVLPSPVDVKSLRLFGQYPTTRGYLRPSAGSRFAKCSAKSAPQLEHSRDVANFENYRKGTRDLVLQRWPGLVDIVDRGTLIAVPRAASYIERRDDGYQEPKLVILLGTSHVSAQSRSDAQRLIQEVRPGSVVVELCRSRVSLLYDRSTLKKDQNGTQERKASNPFNLSGSSFLAAVGRTLQLGGQSALLLRLLLSRQAGRLSDRFGLEIGADMRAAREAAEAVGAQLVLGDRPIEITLQRAWDALSWERRLNFLMDLLKGSDVLNHDVVDVKALDQLTGDLDFINNAIKSICQAYPEV
eukprot:jgi/Botrbrau1/20816/Bobra.0156s0043.2